MVQNLTARARSLRHNQTDAEKKIWRVLRARQINGYRFHRQFVIDPYIVDFVCRDLDIIIEIDGGQHNIDVDAQRTAFLEAKGYKILRFWNNDVLENIDGVCEVIAKSLTPSLSLKGEGEESSFSLQGEG